MEQQTLIGGKRGVAACILNIMQESSDNETPLNSAAIIEKMRDRYGITVNRNTVASNLSLLSAIGYPIERTGKGAYYVNLFDDSEIKILFDAVLTSKYVPAAFAKQLMDRLLLLGSKKLKRQAKNIHLVGEYHHQRNAEFFLTLEVTQEAIDAQCRLAFTYNQYGTDGKLHPRRDDKDIVNPYHIVCAYGRYYLICNHVQHEDIRHYRLDLITSAEKLEQTALRPMRDLPDSKKGLRLSEYIRTHHLMYGGSVLRAVLKMPQSFASYVVDAFGHDSQMNPVDESHMEVKVEGAQEGIRLFARQFGPHCEVISPKELREQIIQDIAAMREMYEV